MVYIMKLLFICTVAWGHYATAIALTYSSWPRLHAPLDGVQQIIELQLTDDEAEKFRHAIEVIKANIARLP